MGMRTFWRRNMEKRVAALESAKGARGTGKAFTDLKDKVEEDANRIETLEHRVSVLEHPPENS